LASKTGKIKIGKAKNPLKRLHDLQVGNGDKLSLLVVIAGDEEAELHARFKRLRTIGEWFRPERPLLKHLLTLPLDQATRENIRCQISATRSELIEVL
jgi:hypothetical protein